MFPYNNAKRFLSKTIRQPGYGLRVFVKRVEALRLYHMGQGQTSLPESVTLFLTHRCNLHCKMCGQDHSPEEDFPMLAAEGLIDELAGFKPHITLFGGEPLLHPDCARLIRRIKQKNMHCLMITNGSLLEPLAKEIVESRLDELNISLDGDRELHDRIRGAAGLFEKVLKGVEEVQALKKQKKRARPLIHLQCTMTSYNYMFLEKLLGVARRAKADSLTFHNLIFMEEKTLQEQKACDERLGCDSRRWEGFVFEPKMDPGLLYKNMKRLLSEKPGCSVDFYPNFSYAGLKKYYQKGQSGDLSRKGLRCLSPWIAAYVFPDLEVRPCLNSSYSFGNLKEKKFVRIWNGDEAKKFRRLLKKEKSFPACLRCTELYRY